MNDGRGPKGNHAEQDHLQARPRRRSKVNLTPARDGHLPKELRVIKRRSCSELNDSSLIGPACIHRIGNRLRNRHVVKRITQLIKCRHVVRCVLRDVRYQRQHFRGIVIEERSDQIEYFAPVHRSQHLRHLRTRELALTVGNGLVSQAQGIAHGAFSRPRDER